MAHPDPFDFDEAWRERDLVWFFTCIRAWRTNPWLCATGVLVIFGLVSGLLSLVTGGFFQGFCERLAFGSALALPFIAARAAMIMLGTDSVTRLQLATASDLVCSDLSRQDLADLQLRGRDLTSSRLTQSNLLAADMMGTLLLDADMHRIIARRARFDYADMSEAVGHRADFRDSSLIGANLTDAIFDSADFRGAVMSDATLMNCDLRRSSFHNADLQGADLRGADLRGANLRGADLRSASIQGADLRGARLDGVDVTGLKMDDLTIWPDGASPLLGTFELTDDDLALLQTPLNDDGE